jgi:pyruvate-formate lyase-activating enzyme
VKDESIRFPLSGAGTSRAFGPGDLPGLHLRELLDLLVPTQSGADVRVDGYKLLNDRHSIHPLHRAEGLRSSKPPEPIDLYEPRLAYIRRILESLLDVVELEADGRPIKIDGFRLKDPAQWLTPGGGAGDIIAHAATRCNLNCRFCYNKGTSPILAPRPREPEEEYREIETRIKHYAPRGRLNLFPNMGSPAEALAHPRILDILEKLRGKTGEVFRISTNGAALTPEMIRALAALAPVYLDVSLNSASPKRRAWLMNDPSPQTAIDSLAALNEARIPFSTVIVPWPFPSRAEMLADLESAVAFASKAGPVTIQISLPGCARALSEEAHFPLEEVWNELKVAAQRLRETTDCPIVIRPGMFEDHDCPDGPNEPTVIGVVGNSPAAAAGLRRGDRLVKVNGLPIASRPQARALLTTLHQSNLEHATLTVERDAQTKTLSVELREFDYPYTPETSTHLGAVFASAGIPREWIERLKDTIVSNGAKQALMLTSCLMRPTLEKMISRNGLFSDTELHLRVPENRFFGGNIFMGDLLVVEDFIHAVRDFIEREGMRPDLIVAPSSPFHIGGWGRDLTGRVYLDIERELGIPVALVDCEPIFD